MREKYCIDILNSFPRDSLAAVECLNLFSYSEIECNSSLYDKRKHQEIKIQKLCLTPFICNTFYLPHTQPISN